MFSRDSSSCPEPEPHMIDEDDLPIGRILTRREAVRLFAVGGATFLVGCRGSGEDEASRVATSGGALPACIAKPELTVGPYFVDKQLDRSDIRIEPTTNTPRPGAPLALTFNVQQIANASCTPLAGAMVDVWHCDAAGVYSGVNDSMLGANTSGQKFLRGYQVTDAKGQARFTTIYPGWYRGRAVHIHFKIRTPASASLANQTDKTYEFTSQLFFDEPLTDRVHAQQPYAAKGQRDLRNENDGIYREGGSVLVLAVTQASSGYAANFDVGLDLSNAAVGRPDRDGGPGGGRRGRPPG
jgi:protocatechuate 3,4-dioxygenase beta subunit